MRKQDNSERVAELEARLHKVEELLSTAIINNGLEDETLS